MNYLQYFFNPRHLFNLRPIALEDRAVVILLVLFGLFVAAGVIINLIAKHKDVITTRGMVKIVRLCLTVGISGLCYVFFGWQGAAVLGARFWLLILAGVTVIWGGFIIKYFVTDVPLMRRQINQKRANQKYIP